ncbi:hypothetical protein [Bacillus massiliigorillae]|uniref:hypothetical protein n=1 Tax=Bacillus massiliigorillae TaxID=1243664 RepID=UPI0003A895F9|nr:hypothetical protein [Bacillus massiliigorillae]
MKKNSTVAKVLLVSALGLTSIGGGMMFYTKSAQAAAENKEINFEQVGKEFFESLKNSKWDEAYSLLNTNLQKKVKKNTIGTIVERTFTVWCNRSMGSFEDSK